VNIYFKAVEDVSMNGAYNASAPDFVTNEILTKKLASHLNKKLFLPNVPKFVIKTVLGEMSVLAWKEVVFLQKKLRIRGLISNIITWILHFQISFDVLIAFANRYKSLIFIKIFQ
jgi:hypothetical protein